MADEYRCGACGSVFQSQDELQSHARSEHQPAQQFSCGKCGGSFSSQDELSEHARSMHAPATA